jgi:predicted ArsR family transcriptional regulator
MYFEFSNYTSDKDVDLTMSDLLRRRLLDSTRGRIVELLESGSSTADELASQLGVSRSAIRVQLTAMERDGVVVRTGTRAGTTRPSNVFELTSESRQFLSKAYLPLLGDLISELETSLTPEQLHSLLRRVGKRLARGLTGRKRTTEDLRSRVTTASELMNAQFGARTHVESNGVYAIVGSACPLAAVTSTHPAVCQGVGAWLSDVIGAPVQECCDRIGQPRCRFEIRKRRDRK